MSDFGDADLLDAFDDDDDFDAKLALLERVVDALRSTRDDPSHDARRDDALRLVAKMALANLEPERVAAIRQALEES